SRAALAFYQEIPWLDNLKQETPNPVHLDDEQISRLYINSQITEWPRKSRTGCEPCDWWRCAIVIMVNYGQRRSDWYNMRTNAVSFEKETVIFKAKKTGKRQILVLNPTVTWHLRKLNPEGREFIFSPSQTNKQLYREWHRIQSAAKVSDPEGMPFTFHSLRATAAMRYHEYFPGTAELLLGHALRRESQVTAKHYLGSAQLKPLWNAIRNIPQPSAFLEAMEADTVKQTE
ncbi:MAG: integrase family protein, partial [Planctomycetaceae bacterium]|nr:integrase family protein [Planctomycetaceae bacterium]